VQLWFALVHLNFVSLPFTFHKYDFALGLYAITFILTVDEE